MLQAHIFMQNGFMVIDGYRFVIGATHVHRTYLKCANFLFLADTTKLAQYVRSNRGTDLVYYEGNTYTPNEKLRQGQKSRDWKCSMYHKAKCRARLVTRLTLGGDIIHVTSNLHTHPSMYTNTQKTKKQPCLERNPLCVSIRPMKMQSKTFCHGE
ncbi:uncharacterized protein LOC110188421 [Drosophila serrata]|uniref:uncharacterized protein LOC110188421 n=1 Tax=Drosophila serrata TaxID=7274 RepID=UPI000A1D1AD7|nr:uncharacterized protein LOC110188421 [Drosophila serrata]